MRDWLKSLEKLEKRIVSGVEMNCTPKVRFFLSNFLGSVQKNLILCVLLWKASLHFLLKLSF